MRPFSIVGRYTSLQPCALPSESQPPSPQPKPQKERKKKKIITVRCTKKNRHILMKRNSSIRFQSWNLKRYDANLKLEIFIIIIYN